MDAQTRQDAEATMVGYEARADRLAASAQEHLGAAWTRFQAEHASDRGVEVAVAFQGALQVMEERIEPN